MIAMLTGKIVDYSADTVILDVGGVGYEIFLADMLSEAIKDEEKTFHIYHSVKEDSETLYGFATKADKILFTQLLSVQSVGPKAAMAIISLGADAVRSAITGEDVRFLGYASGVGKKTAERIVLELKGKMGLVNIKNTPINASDDAIAALVALGFSERDAAMKLAPIKPDLPIEERIKQALKN